MQLIIQEVDIAASFLPRPATSRATLESAKVKQNIQYQLRELVEVTNSMQSSIKMQHRGAETVNSRMRYNLQIIPVERHTANKESFNTAKHKMDEDARLQVEAQRPYDDNVVSFRTWRHIILESRGTQDTTPPAVELGRAFTDELRQKALTAYVTGRVEASLPEELEDEFPSIVERIKSVLESGERWFIRTDECSPKDVYSGPLPVSNFEQLLRQLLLSVRFLTTLERRDDLAHRLRLHFLPWDDEMNSLHEFRVFVPPAPSINDLHITAISQYSWYRPLPAEIKARLAFVVDRADEILKNGILTANDDVVRGLVAGFSFDVLLCERGCVLVELNTFGAMQNTGSCLFHWINDYDILYGLGEDRKIVVRICE